MTFAVALYLAIEAASEDAARKIVDSIESESRFQESISWNGLEIEVEEP